MRWYRGKDGKRAFFLPPEEIATSCEDELHRANMFPTVAAPVLEVDAFIEQHLKAKLDPYADLGPDVLGYVDFPTPERPEVYINRDLSDLADGETDAPTAAVGRLRATMAHEAAHIIFHRVLYLDQEGQGTLFGAAGSPRDRLMRCFKKQFGVVNGSDWREIQANRGMAALLMPAPVFRAVAAEELDRLGLPPGTGQNPRLTAALASRFLVSRQAAAIRLETLRIISPAGQRHLGGA